MKKALLWFVAVLFVGCSYNKEVSTFSIVSAHTIPSPQRVSINDKFCGSSWDNVYDFRKNVVISALNKAKKQGLPADALAEPTFKFNVGFSESCVEVTGKPVGVRLIR